MVKTVKRTNSGRGEVDVKMGDGESWKALAGARLMVVDFGEQMAESKRWT